MHEPRYRVVLTGATVGGVGREQVIASLARLFEISAAELMRAFDSGDHLIDEAMGAKEAAALQKKLEQLGAQARIDPLIQDETADSRYHGRLRLPGRNDPAAAGLMRCPACGHQQLVATRCDECGVVFAEYNRQRQAPRPGAARQTVDRRPQRSRDIHRAAHRGWSQEWVDDGNELPTEHYHLQLFMGQGSEHLSEACQRLLLGRHIRMRPSWVGGAVFSPFLWAMLRKMWAWGAVIFLFEILAPVILFTLGAKEGVSDKLVYAAIGLMIANRIFWPAILKSLYCRHARGTIMAMNRMSPTFASDIDIATTGGTSRTSVFVGSVLALVVSLLAWSVVDALYAEYRAASASFTALPPASPGELPAALPIAPSGAIEAEQDRLLVNENKWVATRNRLRQTGQRLNSWFADAGSDTDPTRLAIDDIARALALTDEEIRDGWGGQIAFRSDGQGYRLISAGPDGEFGTTDDVEYRRILE